MSVWVVVFSLRQRTTVVVSVAFVGILLSQIGKISVSWAVEYDLRDLSPSSFFANFSRELLTGQAQAKPSQQASQAEGVVPQVHC
jgi:hypothetical protein